MTPYCTHNLIYNETNPQDPLGENHTRRGQRKAQLSTWGKRGEQRKLYGGGAWERGITKEKL